MARRFLEEVELVGLSTDWSNLTDGQQTLINQLVENGQQHLFDGWDGPGRNDDVDDVWQQRRVPRVLHADPHAGGRVHAIESARSGGQGQDRRQCARIDRA